MGFQVFRPAATVLTYSQQPLLHGCRNGVNKLCPPPILHSTFSFHSSKEFGSRIDHPGRFVAMASSSQVTPSLTSDEMNEDPKFWKKLEEHQKSAVRLPAVEEVRTLLDCSVRGMLSTFSQNCTGYPSGSLVDFACSEDACPILAITTLAAHSKDLMENPRCSLLVAKDPLDRTDRIVTLYGDAIFVSENEMEAYRAAYLRKHPEAFWVDFGDINFVRIEPKKIRYVSGVATSVLRSGEYSSDEVKAAKVDPLAEFSVPVASHMNRDHAEETRLIVERSTDIKVDHAEIIDLDRLGLNVKAGFKGYVINLRIPFPRPAEDRRDIKNLIVQMVEEAKKNGS